MILAHLDWSEEASEPLRQMRIRDRAPYPSEQEILDRRPALDESAAIGLRAWRACSSCRAIGWGMGPIPQTAIDAWCDRYGLDLIAADYLSDAIRYVDNVILERQAARNKKGS